MTNEKQEDLILKQNYYKRKFGTSVKHIFRFFGIEVGKYKPLRPSQRFMDMVFGDKEIIGAEVGVYLGDNSVCLLRNINFKKLYLIDPYEDYEDYNEDWMNTGEYPSINESEKIMRNTLKPFWDKVRFIKKYSDDAIEDIEEELDFVYIDGNHSYKYVKKDMGNYYKLLKNGGMLSGHDFGNPEFCGSTNAVMEFCIENNLQLFTNGVNWMIIKGGEE